MHKFRLYFSLQLALAVGLSGCHTEPIRPPQKPPFIAAAPEEGQGLIYVFRPAMDTTDTSEYPSLVVDGAKVVAMPRASYTLLSLKPGTHELQMVPRSGESDSWNIKKNFDVTAGKTQFVAVWHQYQETTNSRVGDAGAAAGGRGQGNLMGIFLAHALLDSHTGEDVIDFEPIEQEFALEALSGLRLLKPKIEPVAVQH